MKNKLIMQFVLLILTHSSLWSQDVKKYTVNESEFYSGYYLAVEPADTIEGVLILIAGFGQWPEDVFPETKLEQVAYDHNLLTIAFAGVNKLYADSVTRYNLSLVIKDILTRYKVDPARFVIGSYSAGGMIALRYVELCNELPDRYPIHPKGGELCIHRNIFFRYSIVIPDVFHRPFGFLCGYRRTTCQSNSMC